MQCEKHQSIVESLLFFVCQPMLLPVDSAAANNLELNSPRTVNL